MDPLASRLSLPVTEYSVTSGSSSFTPGHSFDMDTDRILCRIKQGPRTLEQYICEFLAIANYSTLPDCILIEIFCDGLNELLKARLRCEGPRSSLAVFMDYALLCVSSPFTVGVAEEERDATEPLTAWIAREMAAVSERARAMAATTLPVHKMAAAPERMVATIEPVHKMAATAEPVHKMVAETELRHVTAAIPEPCRVAAVFPESSQVSKSSQVAAVFPESSQVSESSQVAAVFPESSQVSKSSQVAAAFPESSQVSRSSQAMAAVPGSSQATVVVPVSRQVKAVFPVSSQVRAIAPVSSQVTAIFPEPSTVKMAITPEPLHKMAAQSQVTSRLTTQSQVTSRLTAQSQGGGLLLCLRLHPGGLLLRLRLHPGGLLLRLQLRPGGLLLCRSCLNHRALHMDLVLQPSPCLAPAPPLPWTVVPFERLEADPWGGGLCYESGRCSADHSPPDVALTFSTHSDCCTTPRTTSPSIHRADCICPRDLSAAL
ncbi:hypothetical protein M9458_057834 [Cirrhinus mrigala]|uniref:Retrotransposon gag domain-containing protein n=1 Tax=Cirrhinus mrigala TaxID=683832 RepID=A0ABD0MD92_CIRMR